MSILHSYLDHSIVGCSVLCHSLDRQDGIDNNTMHPLVRDLYKRALLVGKEYPLGLEYVRRTWKTALRNPQNCPSCYLLDRGGTSTTTATTTTTTTAATNTSKTMVRLDTPGCEKELRKAVARGRFMVREMIGVIQLKKYRAMKRRYDVSTTSSSNVYSHLPLAQPESKSDV